MDKNAGTLKDFQINVKIKISALWMAVMFLYIYVDHFALLRPDIFKGLLDGKMAGLQTNQVFLLSSMVLMTVPILMIALSLVLKAKASRWTNMIVAAIYLLIVVGNTIGETWAFYIFGSIVEAVLLVMIIRYAWLWPKE